MVMFVTEMDELEHCGLSAIVNPLKAKALDEELLRAARLHRWLNRSGVSIDEAIERALREA